MISKWMWLQFAPYVKSKSRFFWKSKFSLFFPNSDVAVYYSSQGRFFFFVYVSLRHILKNGHKWSKNVISGPDFLKNDDIWSNFIKLDEIGSTLVSAS